MSLKKMNGDILFEIVKYVNNSDEHKIKSLMLTKEYMRRKINLISEVLERKLIKRPSIEDLKEKNILKDKKIEVDEIRKMLSSIMKNNKEDSCPSNRVAPSISKIVKKMDFEYKKILIRYKLRQKG